MVDSTNIEEEKIRAILDTVHDPEVPVLTINDLGIVREVRVLPEKIEIVITSTYTGCPAMDMIAAQIRMTLAEHGYQNIQLITALSPAWTTDWMSEDGKRKLKEYGIAPPDRRFSIPVDGVECPHCHSHSTTLVSEFGSTACKALYRCEECKEPFDYFKCH